MNRYKFTVEGISETVKYLKGQSKTAPSWAKRYKSDLKVNGSKVLYKGMEIIAKSKVDDWLRTEMFKKDGTLPFGRDAAHHQLKTRVVGVTRRHLMKFIKSQTVFEETKAAVPKAKRKGGKRLKTYTVETDLVFIRKNDLVNNGGQRFEKTVDKEETYIVSTTEATTGLCRLNFVRTKAAPQVTEIVIKHIRSIAKALKVHPRTMAYRSDFGGEFDLAKIKAVIPDAQNVKVAASVEKKNQDAQRVFYRILKSRRSVAIPDALQQTEKLLNSTYNRVHKATPDELVAKSNKEFNIKTYNQGRKSYIAGDNRKPFVVGQRVRIQIKKDKGLDLKYKSYKNITFSRRVYIIKKVTKSKPFRYWVNSKWLTQDKLKATEAEDEKTKQLVKDRDNAQAEADKKVEEKREAEEAEKRKAQEVVKEREIAAGTRRRTRRRNPEQDKKRLEREARMKLLDAQLQADEDEVQAAKARKEGVSPRRRRRKRVVRGSKYERDGEEEWKPHRRKPRIRRV